MRLYIFENVGGFNYGSVFGKCERLRICAIIWLILLCSGSLIAAIIIWNNSSHSYYSHTYVNGGMVALGFGVLAGGVFVAVLTFFLFSCIADIANESFDHYVRIVSTTADSKLIDNAVRSALEAKKELFVTKATQEDAIENELPPL